MSRLDEILSFDDRPVITVDVPEWGEAGKCLTFREPDAATSMKIAKSAQGEDGKVDELDLVVKTIIEASVEPKFQPGHIEALKLKSEVALTRIFKAIKNKKNEPLKS